MATNYGLFFSYAGRVIRLPVNPEELPQIRENNNSEYNILGIGPVTVPRIPKQKEVRISSYFPGRVNSSVLTPNNFMAPEDYIQFFERALNEKLVLTYTPVRYTEDGRAFDTSDPGFRCLVQSFTTTEKGGETGDFYYELVIREYRDYSPQTVIIANNTTDQDAVVATQTPNRETPDSVIVVGSVVIASGNYYYTSYGEDPHGVASGIKCVVTRIADESRACQYHINTADGKVLGWVARSALALTGEVSNV